MKNFSEFGIAVPEILLPAEKDLSSWSVIACDQYTQDLDYWKKVSDAVGEKPSTLNIILPEVYLSSPDRKGRIEKIRNTMNGYLSGNVFSPAQKEFIYVERTTGYGRVRKGLVVALDLESYEWKPMSRALVRATEATIVERIPPRKEIRRGAPLESPHIMLLVNDPDHTLIEAAGESAKKSEPVYDGELMMGAGHISGWSIKSEEDLDRLYSALESLKKAGTEKDGSSFMFAVGDGNHSLATAKAVWDEYKEELSRAGKSKEEIESSPVRYALVELVNIYDPGLTFEPIHRVLFGADPQKTISYVQKNLGGTVSECGSANELEDKVKKSQASFGFVYTESGKNHFVLLETPVKELAVARFQPVLDEFIADEKKSVSGIEIDYIHGSDEVFRLGQKDGALTFLLPPIAKDSFFATISGRGPLPRKSFSMGEASEKRFYLECRKLF
ncbi:MAG: DUF1015 domain-containing protein [Treponema sp.]|nr:DUF1015 domain-containing protein [Treponema sp.]MBQ4237383.1 DUF1015 domain-containing protein [Treponema sp.]